jgi:hypothetical protein
MTHRPITPDTVLIELALHIGALHGISARDLVAAITGSPEPDPAGERELREAVVALRLEGCHVCGFPATGYFMAANDKELDSQCLWLFDRAMTSLKQIAAMKRVSLPDLRGQLRLRT